MFKFCDIPSAARTQSTHNSVKYTKQKIDTHHMSVFHFWEGLSCEKSFPQAVGLMMGDDDQHASSFVSLKPFVQHASDDSCWGEPCVFFESDQQEFNCLTLQSGNATLLTSFIEVTLYILCEQTAWHLFILNCLVTSLYFTLFLLPLISTPKMKCLFMGTLQLN